MTDSPKTNPLNMPRAYFWKFVVFVILSMVFNTMILNYKYKYNNNNNIINIIINASFACH